MTVAEATTSRRAAIASSVLAFARRRHRRALIGSLVYAVLGGAWILASDHLLSLLIDVRQVLWFSTVKGLGFVLLSAGLIYLAARRGSASEDFQTGPRGSADAEVSLGLARQDWVQWGAMLLVLLIGIGMVSAWLVRSEGNQMRRAQADRLSAMAHAKANLLDFLLNARRDQVRQLVRSDELRQAMLSGQVSPALEEIVRRQRWLRVELWSEHGTLLGVANREGRTESLTESVWQPTVSRLIAQGVNDRIPYAVASAQPFHRVALIAPLGFVQGLLVLELDASGPLLGGDSLFQKLMDSASGEMLLLRRQGEGVEVLNTPRLPRQVADAASVPTWNLDGDMDLRSALEAPAAVVRGIDDRGVMTLAALVRLNSVPWHLMVKLDEREALGPLYQLILGVLLLLLLAVGLSVLLLMFLRARGRLNIALAQARTEARFRRYAEQAPLGILVISSSGLIIELNRHMGQLLGLGPRHLSVLHTQFDRFLPESRRQKEHKVWATMTLGQSMRTEGSLVTLDGTALTVGVTAVCIEPDRILAFFEDITVRKSEDLRQRLSTVVFQNTQEGLAVTDIDARILAVNPAFCRITGYTEAELIGEPMRLLRSSRQDDRFYRDFWGALKGAGHWEGEVVNRRKSGEEYPERLTVNAVRDDQGLIVSYVAACTDITGAKRSEADLKYLAHHDLLTGLPNRVLLMGHLSRCLASVRRHGGRGAVLLLDLDRFKNVNDSLGHAAGDQLLRAMSQRLVERMRETDLVARLGGDEFVIVLDQIGEAREAGQVAHQVIEVLSRPFELRSGQEVYTGASVGISVFPDDGDDAQKLLQQADAALYQAKGNGRGNYCFHTEELTQAAQRRLQMETRLRRALEHDELELHYQPLIDARSRRIIGLEVLARWFDNGSKQMIPPSQFIPVAEETRLILRLGEWVLYQACWQMAQWVREGIAPDIIAVNLSPIQFAQTDLSEKIARILERTGLPGHRLELEITESALLDASLATERLTALKALGVRLAIDDFGTGYSSLSYLSRFPLDKLKVDQSFVRGIPNDATSTEITSVIVTMGHTLGLEVLAEGVETALQDQFLIEHGCDTLQGWLFARAVPVDEATALLRTGEIRPPDAEPENTVSG